MRFNLTVQMDNAAFEDPAELPRILAKLAGQLEDRPEGWNTGNVLDVNGNNVGAWEVVED